MLSAKEYLNNIAQTPKESYKSIIQASLISEWEDNTQMYTIKEQRALPFVNEYDEYEVYLDIISDDMINTSKVYSDFVKIIFKDCDHKQNYKGQYYKLSIDDNSNEEYYICYDRINRLSQISDTKVVRCNNVLTWRDKYGNIVTMPCYLGTDITSTNNQVSKDATIPNNRMIILIQANDYTTSIRNNQRFMFQHSSCFKVEEVNNFMQEQGTDGEITCVKIYVSYSDLLPNDNKELNICDYYDNHFTLALDQEEDIEQVNGFVGKLNAIVKDGGNNIVDMPLEWSTSDSKVVEIDEQGNYQVVGKNGDMAIIKCSMVDNKDIYDTVAIKVVENYIEQKEIIITPNDIKYIKQGNSQEFNCGVFVNGQRQDIKVYCNGSGIDNKYYNIEETKNGYKVTNIKTTTTPLILTFSAEDCNNVEIKILLKGVV